MDTYIESHKHIRTTSLGQSRKGILCKKDYLRSLPTIQLVQEIITTSKNP